MTVIVMLTALLVERFFDCRFFRRWHWLISLSGRIHDRFPSLSPYWQLILTILPGILLALSLNWLLAHWLYGFLKLLFQIIVVLYCFGPKNFWVSALTCLNALSTYPIEAILDCLKQHYVIPTTCTDKQALHQCFLKQLFIQAYYQVAVIIFWYGCFGIAGAFFYRAMTLLSSPATSTTLSQHEATFSANQEQAHTIQFVLDWVPVRLFTFMFALSGHFILVFNYWKQAACQWRAAHEDLLAHCGLAALALSPSTPLPEEGTIEKQALSLIDRVFMITLSLMIIVMLLAAL